jgi:hypothetical protein
MVLLKSNASNDRNLQSAGSRISSPFEDRCENNPAPERQGRGHQEERDDARYPDGRRETDGNVEHPRIASAAEDALGSARRGGERHTLDQNSGYQSENEAQLVQRKALEQISMWQPPH